MKAIILSALMSPLLSISALGSGSSIRGGGDPCENQIKIIRKDLKNWIQKGGPEALEFPANTNVGNYSSAMLERIANTKIRCVSAGNADFPIEIDGTPKVCKFDFEGANESRITCGREDFMKMTEPEQYVLIHHEYAGLAGVEQPTLADSKYDLSNQISDFLHPQTVYRLGLKKNPKPAKYPGPNYCDKETGISAAEPDVIMCDLNGTEGSDNFLIRIPQTTGRCSRTNLHSTKTYYLNVDTSVVDSGRTVTKTIQIVNTFSNEPEYIVAIDRMSNTGFFSFRLGAGTFLSGVCRPYHP